MNDFLDDTAGDMPEILSSNQQVTQDRRTEARLCAVQAVYQCLMMPDQPAASIKDDFQRHNLVSRKVDKNLFAALFDETLNDKERYQTLVNNHLAESWTFDRLDIVEQALLLTAAAELSTRPETPHKVILDEYLNLAHAYFEQDKVGFINAVLDKITKQIRG